MLKDGDYQLELYLADMLGKGKLIDNRGVEIKAATIENTTLSFDMTSASSGVYILLMKQGHRVVMKKVIKKVSLG